MGIEGALCRGNASRCFDRNRPYPSNPRAFSTPSDILWSEIPSMGKRWLFRGYDTGDARDAMKKMGRQALHAKALRFYHPVRQVELEFSTPLPADMAMLCDALRKDAEDWAMTDTLVQKGPVSCLIASSLEPFGFLTHAFCSRKGGRERRALFRDEHESGSGR